MPQFEDLHLEGSRENAFDILDSFIEEQGLDNLNDLYLQDTSGALHDGGPGVFIIDEANGPHKYMVEKPGLCNKLKEEGSNSNALFCPDVCIRRGE
jgi:hypothetical protein